MREQLRVIGDTYMKIWGWSSASQRVMWKHYGRTLTIIVGCFLAGIAIQRFTSSPWIRWSLILVMLVYVIKAFLAPFGYGRDGRELTKAALEDERASWRN